MGRIYFYRPVTSPLGIAIRPSISLNDVELGSSAPGTFFYADRAPGRYEVSMSATQLLGHQTSKVSVTLEPGQSLYVWVGMDGFKFTTKLVDTERGMREIRGLRRSQ
jgi:hypothetical protein